MFNSIRGTVTAKNSDSVYIDSGAIEWDISASRRSIAALGPVGSETRVFTWLYHREDQMRIFGFADLEERSLFLDLQKVEGIGPKQAMKILSGISATEFEAALELADLNRLTAVPGLGMKTAQKIVLALKGKLSYAREKDEEPEGVHEDLVTALVDMGFDRKRSREVVDTLNDELLAAIEGVKAEEREREIFRRAIVLLTDRKGR
jgi:holliday junction DNA helicase RuvA